MRYWLFASVLAFGVSVYLLAEEARIKGKSWLDGLDFHMGGSLDFAYTQTPLHYLSYLDASQKDRLSGDMKEYLKDASKTVSNGVGFGTILGLGYRLLSNSPFSFGLEYQFSTAGSEASDLKYLLQPSEPKSLSLSAGYLDHRIRLYAKLTPRLSQELAFSFNVFLGMSIIHLRNLRIQVGDKVQYRKLSSLRYADGKLVFLRDAYVGLDVGLRISFYMLDMGFDLALTPLFTIPRFLVGCSFNSATLKLLSLR